jgi:hypothetical protein
MTLFKLEGFLEVRYEEAGEYIVFDWDDFSIPLAEIKRAHEAALRCAIEGGCRRYIAYCARARDSLLPEVIVWWRATWVPRMVAAGIRRIVTVPPTGTFSTMSNRDWQRESGSGMETINVDSLAKAIEALSGD